MERGLPLHCTYVVGAARALPPLQLPPYSDKPEQIGKLDTPI